MMSQRDGACTAFESYMITKCQRRAFEPGEAGGQAGEFILRSPPWFSWEFDVSWGRMLNYCKFVVEIQAIIATLLLGALYRVQRPLEPRTKVWYLF